MTQLKDMSLEDLKVLKHVILSKNAHWLSCQDGSYERALHTAGFSGVCDEIARRTSTE